MVKVTKPAKGNKGSKTAPKKDALKKGTSRSLAARMSANDVRKIALHGQLGAPVPIVIKEGRVMLMEFAKPIARKARLIAQHARRSTITLRDFHEALRQHTAKPGQRVYGAEEGPEVRRADKNRPLVGFARQAQEAKERAAAAPAATKKRKTVAPADTADAPPAKKARVSKEKDTGAGAIPPPKKSRKKAAPAAPESSEAPASDA